MITEQHRNNARKLADFLEYVVAKEHPEHFYMGAWVGSLDPPPDRRNADPRAVSAHYAGTNPVECGTTACALGWAPYALGIPMRVSDWFRYAEQIFGIQPKLGAVFAYLFIDDDARGSDAALAAAQRLREFADDQLPPHILPWRSRSSE